MKRFFFDCGTRDLAASFGVLFLRVSTGLMMLLGHGLPKYRNFDKLKTDWYVPGFTPLKYMSHEISLWATLGAEVVAAGLLIAGLATRPAAFVFAFAMVVAAFEVHHSAPMFLGQGVTAAKEPAVLYLVFASTILLLGSGRFSIDSLIYKGPKTRRW